MATPPAAQPEGTVTYREMVDYVTDVTNAIRDRAQAHDDWHRGQLVAQNRQIWAAVLAGLGAIVAAGSALASALLTHGPK